MKREKIKQETRHEMRIPERDDLLSVYLFTLIRRSVDIYGSTDKRKYVNR